ncbi:MAG: DUF3470 domain-containing protein, partial [Gammaproteobacteria bacterium]|nr:DUF3470 domain-containing protein [Gammaproteobacteria bacterium]
CDLCTPECPAEAIFQEDELPENMQHFKALNVELAALWPVITEVIPAPDDADDWDGVTDKEMYLVLSIKSQSSQ